MDWTKDEIKFLKTLRNPDKIQGFLDQLIIIQIMNAGHRDG